MMSFSTHVSSLYLKVFRISLDAFFDIKFNHLNLLLPDDILSHQSSSEIVPCHLSSVEN